MAKSKESKAEARRARATRLDRERFNTFVATVKDAKQDLDDAGMAHAAEWKKADPLGIHPEAAKLYCRLDKMEDAKRTDFLRAFDLYRGWAEHWRLQADLLERHEETEERETADRDAAEPPLDYTDRAPAPSTEQVLAEQEEEADPVDDTAAEATEELAGAGYTFAAGKGAAIDGKTLSDNPHPEGTPSHPIWARGHASGALEMERGEDEPETVVPLRGRGRRNATTEAPAAVH